VSFYRGQIFEFLPCGKATCLRARDHVPLGRLGQVVGDTPIPGCDSAKRMEARLPGEVGQSRQPEAIAQIGRAVEAMRAPVPETRDGLKTELAPAGSRAFASELVAPHGKTHLEAFTL
jgi:hypothetical protein